MSNEFTISRTLVNGEAKQCGENDFQGLTQSEHEQVLQAEREFKVAREKYAALAHLREKRSNFILNKRIAARAKRKPSNKRWPPMLKSNSDEVRTIRNALDLIKRGQDASEIKSTNRMNELSHDELLELFQRSETIDVFAASLGIPRRQSIARLKTAGVDIFEDISAEWENGTSLRKLGKKYGVMPQTISNWIKSTGREIKPRNSNKRYDPKQIIAFRLQGWSPNKIAIHMKLSWATVQKTIDNEN